MTVQDRPPATRTPAPRRPTRGRSGSVAPARILVLAVTVGTLVVALAAALTAETDRERTGLAQIATRSAPVVTASTDLYFALNDMDAQLANVLLVGDATTLGLTSAQAVEIFEQRRLQTDRDLQQAASAATDPTTARRVRDLLDDLGRYEALAAQTLLLDGQADHPPGLPAAATLTLYRQATDLLSTVLLPAARALTDQHAQALERTYRSQYHRTLAARVRVIVLGGAALCVLILLQCYLARRFRRLVNPAVAAATVLTAVLVLGGTLHTTQEADHLRTAKKGAFDSILVLAQARAVSYDANADESRYLLDPARADRYQKSFLTKTRQLLDLPGADLAGYDQRLTAAARAYQQDHRTVGWNGLLGTEFRNITFTGERAAADTTLTRYQAYQLDDRRLRQLAGSGRLRDAIAFCTSYAPGASNAAFDQYDQSLAALTGINQRAFDINVHDGEHDLSWWLYAPAVAALIVLLLVAVGVRGRLAEYR